MIRKLLFLAVVGGGLLVGDFAAKGYAESKMESRIEEGTPGEQRPSAEIESFPFLGRLLVSGTVGDVRMRAHAVSVDAGVTITFDVVELILHGVRVDRDLLFQKEVKLREIDAGTVRLMVERPIAFGRAPIPPTPLIPCSAEARGEGETVLISCRFEEVPQLFVDVANRQS